MDWELSLITDGKDRNNPHSKKEVGKEHVFDMSTRVNT